jgi:hypothetical protein
MARPLRSSERKIKELDRENAKLVSEIKRSKDYECFQTNLHVFHKMRYSLRPDLIFV